MDFFANIYQNDAALRLLLALVLVLVVVVIVRVALRLATRYITDPEKLYATSRTIRRAGGVVAVMLLLGVVLPENNIATLLTVIGAGLAIALREVLLDIAGWVKLTLMTAYKRGDRIEINDVHGDVVDIRLLRTTLMQTRGWVDADQSTGRIVHFPNNWLYQHAVFNYSRGFSYIWNELPVTVTFRSDWEAARDIMRSLADEAADMVEQQATKEIHDLSSEFVVYYSILTPFVYVRITPNGVQLTLRYLCDVRKRRGTEHALTVSMLQAFSDHGQIEFAYPMVGHSAIPPPQFGPIPAAKQP